MKGSTDLRSIYERDWAEWNGSMFSCHEGPHAARSHYVPPLYSIVHATQFFEFWKGISDDATNRSQVRVPPVFIQPIAAEDVANAVAKVAVSTPLNGMVEVAGPQRFRFDEFLRLGFQAHNDPREVVVDPNARYFAAKLSELTLVASGEARIAASGSTSGLARRCLTGSQ